jgi:hypothetical protein
MSCTQIVVFFSDPGGGRWRPFSCSRLLLDTQKKAKSVARRKNHEKKRKNGPHWSQAQSWVGGAGVARGYQPTIKKASTGY